MNPVVRSDIVVSHFLDSVGGYRHKDRRDRLLDILDIVPATIRELTIVVRESDCFNTLNWRQMEGRLSKFTELTRLSFRLCKGGDSFRSREGTANILQEIYRALPAFKARNALFL